MRPAVGPAGTPAIHFKYIDSEVVAWSIRKATASAAAGSNQVNASGGAVREGLDINLLRILVALEERRSVSLVAKAMRRSQPSISSALGRLRKQMGDPLFLRSGPVMVPTPRAASVVAAARAALDIVDRQVVPPSNFDPAKIDQPVRLGMTDAGEIVFLPRIFEALRALMPKAAISSHSPLADIVGRELELGRIDLAIGYFPDLAGQAFSQQVLFSDTYACLIRVDHPIRTERLTDDQFRKLEHAVVRAESRTEEVMERFLAKRAVRRRVAFNTPHFASIPLLIARSNLIATVPVPIARHFVATNKNLRIVGLPFKPPTIALKQFWHCRYQHDARSQWLRARIFELFERNRSA